MKEIDLDEIRRIRNGFTLKGSSAKGVILVHGIGGNAAGVYSLAKYLNEQNNVTAVGLCLKGHASQPKDLKKVSYQDWLSQAEGAYQALKKTVSDITLIGNSLGSLVMLALAERHPEVKLVLISSPLYYAHPIFYLARFLSFFGIYHVWHGFTGMSKERADLVCYSKIPYKAVAEMNALQHHCRKNIGSLTGQVSAYFGGKDPLVGVSKSERFLSLHVPNAAIHESKEDGHGLLFAPDAEALFAAISALFA
jgi:esterase/lipase